MFIADNCKNCGVWYSTTSDTCIKCGYPKNEFGVGLTFLGQKIKEGVTSPSMGVDTKPSKKLEYKGHWILVEGNISDADFNELKEKIK